MDHVVVRRLEHLAGDERGPRLGFAVETRERPGPAFKRGAFPDDPVWVQLHGGLFVARARVELGWVGEYSGIAEVRARTRGAELYDLKSFWAGRPRFGYAAVASLVGERWVEPFWAGPRTYAYDWIVLDGDKKKTTWLEPREPPREGAELSAKFRARWPR